MAAKTVIVLIPGAFHRPSVWNAVAEPLRKAGFTVITPSLAVCSDLSSKEPDSPEWKELANKGPLDDTEAIHQVLVPLLDSGCQAVIVSHSYGAVPATLAIEGQTVEERATRGLKGGIKSFVMVAGFTYPVKGKSIMGDESEPPLMPYHTLDNGIIHLHETAKPLWYSDLAPEMQDAAWADLFKHQSRKSFLLFPQFIAADITIPKTFVLTEQDQTLPPEFQAMSIQGGQFENVVKLASGHTPLLSMPEKIVEIIVDAAGK